VGLPCGPQTTLEVVTMRALFILAMVCTSLVLGCSGFDGMSQELTPGRGSTRILGKVDYQQSFAVAREVLGQHYNILEADAQSGLIRCRPKKVNAKNERILGGFPARQIAALQISVENGPASAKLVNQQHRHGAASYKQMGYAEDNYSLDPSNSTPAQLDAATTPVQNQAWKTEKTLPTLERQILNELYKRMHPEAVTR
jgi:hypothetical protein